MDLSESPREEAQAILQEVEDLPLYQHLEMMDAYDEMLEDPNFDPSTLIGPIEATRAGIKNKIDATEKVMFGLKSAIQRNEDRIEFWIKKRNAVQNNLDRLKEYLHGQMTAHKYDTLAGNEFVLKLQRNSNPSLSIMGGDPTEKEAFRYPKYVAEVPAQLVWRTDTIRQDLKDGVPEAREVGFLSYGTHLKFSAVDAPKQRKKK